MKLPALLTIAVVFSATAFGQTASDVYGTWVTADQNGHITISDCGDGTPCGELAWINMDVASSDKDINNPDRDLRDRELVGIQMVWGFSQRGTKWRSGKVYDPEAGRTYNARIEATSADTLKLTGCFGPICQSQTWTRLSGG